MGGVGNGRGRKEMQRPKCFRMRRDDWDELCRRIRHRQCRRLVGNREVLQVRAENIDRQRIQADLWQIFEGEMVETRGAQFEEGVRPTVSTGEDSVHAGRRYARARDEREICEVLEEGCVFDQ